MKLCTITKYKRIITKLKNGNYPKDIALEMGVTTHVVYNAKRYLKVFRERKSRRICPS